MQHVDIPIRTVVCNNYPVSMLDSVPARLLEERSGADAISESSKHSKHNSHQVSQYSIEDHARKIQRTLLVETCIEQDPVCGQHAFIGGILHNRRRHMRVPVRAHVVCIVNSHTFRGVTYNFSRSGIQVKVPELKRKAYVQLSFRLPLSETIIDVRGAVVWSLKKRHGIEFEYKAEQSHDSIRRFIEERVRSGALSC